MHKMQIMSDEAQYGDREKKCGPDNQLDGFFGAVLGFWIVHGENFDTKINRGRAEGNGLSANWRVRSVNGR